MSPDQHQRFRNQLAARMDGPLPPDEAAALEAHLATCPSCQAVDHEYEADRARMRAVPGHEPPRDLWARTRAALDQEVADGGDAFPSPLGRGRPGRQLRLAAGSLAIVILVMAITGGQIAEDPPAEVPSATPFAIPAQSIAFVGLADGALTVYRASVREVCPPPRLDCADGPDGEPVVRVEAGLAARQLAMSQAGQLLITGRDDLGAEVFAIVTMPDALPADEVPGAGAEGSPAGSEEPVTSPDPGAPGAPTRDPALEPTDPPTPEPTDGPDELPGTASASPEPGDSVIVATPNPGTAVATSQPILSDVIATGAAAAWSPDGSVLAFSAMPVDRSHGSDVYVWRPGDDQAHAVTDDHASLFASWAGDRIVISRTDADAAEGTELSGRTVVLDPGNGESRAVELDGAWLPSVDPNGQLVVYWRGRLTQRAGIAVPDEGRLYIADWRDLDPWRSRRSPRDDSSRSAEPADAAAGDAPAPSGDASAPADPAAASPEPATEPAASPADGSQAAEDAGGQPASDASATDDATTGTEGAPPEAAGDPAAAGSGSESGDQTADETPSGARASNGRDTEGSYRPVRPRAVSGRTREWVVRWSTDGGAFAVWTAEPGSTTRGWLIVRGRPEAGSPAGSVLVDRVHAGRAFGMGAERIAWVAPLTGGEGELWVSVWGEGGQGSVRLRRVDAMEAVPAY